MQRIGVTLPYAEAYAVEYGFRRAREERLSLASG